jgi:hypothetical protein
MRVLAFDIGVKNLAYAVVTEDRKVHALENVNLLEPVEVLRCSASSCPHAASWRTPDALFCKRHLPKSHPAAPAPLLAKKVTVKDVKEWLRGQGVAVDAKATAPVLWALVHARVALPVQAPKQPAVATLSMDDLHDALRAFVFDRVGDWQGVTHVLLENQPVFKNPHMKTVQVLLYATLRDWFYDHAHSMPEFRLVHAKKKVAGEKGDAGYAERKQKSEARVRELFQTHQVTDDTLYDKWTKAKKKSDMADALCMCVDFLGS